MVKPKLQLTLVNYFSEGGFTLFEVLIAILVASAFLLVSLQSMAINAFLKVKQQRQAKAAFWIQEDLEQVRAIAASIDATNGIPVDNTKCNPNAYANGYAQALITKLGTLTLPADTDRKLLNPQNTNDKEFDLVRTYDQTSPAPFRVLRIISTVEDKQIRTYNQSNPNDPKDPVIARVYTEVIPNAALRCPPSP
jgi:type II secretory pathway pseudopilin PulG